MSILGSRLYFSELQKNTNDQLPGRVPFMGQIIRWSQHREDK